MGEQITHRAFNVDPHRLFSGLRLSAQDRLQDGGMLFHRTTHARLVHGGAAAFATEIGDRIEHQAENLIFRNPGDLAVKGEVGLHRGGEIAGRFEIAVKASQALAIRRGGALGGTTGDLGLKGGAHLQGLPEALSFLRQQQAGGARHRGVEAIGDADSDPLPHLNEPLEFEPLRRFAHDGPTHPELLRKMPLGGQQPVHRQSPGANRAGKLVGEVFYEGVLP